jgi:hypothetical protein
MRELLFAHRICPKTGVHFSVRCVSFFCASDLSENRFPLFGPMRELLFAHRICPKPVSTFRSDALSGVFAGLGDFLHMPVVGAAAAAQHRDMAQAGDELGLFAAQLDRVAVVEIGRGVQLGVAALGGVRPQARRRCSQGSPAASASAKCVGCAQLIM